jgi:ATP-dependent RNA helicase DDX49/DBP8
MATKKRVALTADDLLRLQEDGSRKRQRLSAENENEQSEQSSESEPEDFPEEPRNSSPSSHFTLKSRQQPDVKPVSSQSSPTFISLGISPALISALTKMSIQTPTEIQAACIPPLFEGEPSLTVYDVQA